MVGGIDVRPLSKLTGGRMRVLQLVGVLLFVPSALAFYHLVDRRTDSPIGLSDGSEHIRWLGFRAVR